MTVTTAPHASTANEIAVALGVVDVNRGLSAKTAAVRLAEQGPNVLPRPKRTPLWRRLVGQLSSPLVLTLLVAAAISVAVSWRASSDGPLARYGDAIAILLIVLLNAVLGLAQESKADAAVEALGKMSVPRVRVRREGIGQVVSAEDVVVGDILEIEAGDAVAADARLIETSELRADEASLTGESSAVAKNAESVLATDVPLADKTNMVWLGTTVASGRATAVVTATGPRTELGRIGKMMESAERGSTPLEAMLEEFGRRVLFGCLALSALLFAWSVIEPRIIPGAHTQPWHVSLLVAVSLAVAAIPEGLPAITTITLARGTRRMAKRGAIVRKLPAVETLGAATFICSDKTGTLTQNVMTVRSVWTPSGTWEIDGAGYGPTAKVEPAPDDSLRALAIAAATCNHADVSDGKPVGDPTEAALVALAQRIGLSVRALREEHPIVSEIPFDSARRRMTVVTNAAEQYMKGALDAVLDRCTLDAGKRPMVESAAAAMAQKGLRVLAIARKSAAGGADAERGLELLGITGMSDPPRAGVKESIALCHKAGIAVAMITGDHPQTAAAIAREIGLMRSGDETLTGRELDALSAEDLGARIDRICVFARTSPEQKLRIVHALKARGHVVAMTGDGVNDAPALREAHIGVAMGRGGTEVARQAADVVLADDDFNTILAAVEEGRVIYKNLRKFIFFLLSANAGLCGAVFLAAVVADWPTFTPLMLLWINLVTNGLPALALGVDPPSGDVMAAPPRKLGTPLLSGMDWGGIAVVGVVMTASSAVLHVHASPDPNLMLRGRALGFSYLALGALLHAYGCSSDQSVLFRLDVFRRPLTLAVIASALIHLVAVGVPALRPVFKTYPLDIADVTKLALLCLTVVPAFEIYKWFARRNRGADARMLRGTT